MPQEYVARWSGGRIGAGATVFHFESIGSNAAAQILANGVRTFFDSLKGFLPQSINIDFDTEVRDLTSAGGLSAVYPITKPAAVVGTNVSSYAAGTGLLVRHTTGVIAGGRRLQGRTFLVPIGSANFTNTGEALPATQTTIAGYFATLKATAGGTGANFAVWSRKNATVAPIQVSTVVSRVTTLRTRNDRL